MLLSIISTLSTQYLHYQLGGDAGPVIAAEVPRLCHGRLEVQHLCARTLQLPSKGKISTYLRILTHINLYLHIYAAATCWSPGAG